MKSMQRLHRTSDKYKITIEIKNSDIMKGKDLCAELPDFVIGAMDGSRIS